MASQSEECYRSVINGNYDSRLKRSLENIKAVCDEGEQHGARIYVGRIGKLCKEKFGGPAAQSIRNKPDTLKRYIDLRAAEQVLPAGGGQKEGKLNISDPKTRACILLLEAELRDARETIRILKRLLEKMTPVEIDRLIADGFSNAATLTLLPVSTESEKTGLNGICLNDPLRRALEKITSASHLELFRLSLYKGRVIDEMKRKFLDKDEHQALLDLLAAGDSDPKN